MSCEVRNMSVLAYANSFTLWHYKTNDSLRDVRGPNYFSNVGDLLSIGDMVMVTSGNTATIVVVSHVDHGDIIDVAELQ